MSMWGVCVCVSARACVHFPPRPPNVHALVWASKHKDPMIAQSDIGPRHLGQKIRLIALNKLKLGGLCGPSCLFIV